MKKFLLGLIMVFALNFSSFANTTPVDFVYIHGSDQGTIEEFQVWMKKMHPDMKKHLEANPTVAEHFLKNNSIKSEPDMFYWEDKTIQDRQIVDRGLEIAKTQSNAVAQGARALAAHLLHDAIWLQKYENMKPVLDELNKKVIANCNKGEKTLLLGYSAGTFITYQYLLNKSKFINIAEFYNKYKKELNLSADEEALAKTYAPGKTCIDAIVDAKIAFVNADGALMLNSNVQERKANFKKLKQQTTLSCSPDNAVVGVINFASPIVVFYSGVADAESQANYLSRKMVQNLVETDKFYLTVNFNKDPLGVPVENTTFNAIKQQKGFENIKNCGGFRYDTLVKGGGNVLAAHLKYWDQTKTFTKAVAKSFEKGYNSFYEIK